MCFLEQAGGAFGENVKRASDVVKRGQGQKGEFDGSFFQLRRPDL